jgi:signal peptidase I
MVSTIVFAVIFIGLVMVSIVLWALFLRLGLRWAKVPNVTKRRVLFSTAVVLLLQVAANVVLRFASPSFNVPFILLALLEIAATVIIPCMVISRVFKTHFLRAVQAWLPTLLTPIITIAFALFVLRPCLYEAFVSPTNAMAPTLLGKHWKNTCPECGQPNFCTPADMSYAQQKSPLMICENFHIHQVSQVVQKALPPDYFVVAKFLAPRRWDVVVFQYPEDPAILYVMRLVGLPGETIQIEDGAVLVNGKRIEPPQSVRDIEWSSELSPWRTNLWGSKDRPAVLGTDEYFVLGDFSPQAKDSRLWERGASGHHPFAVPESHLRGVVTHIYWPPHRWRILR